MIIANDKHFLNILFSAWNFMLFLISSAEKSVFLILEKSYRNDNGVIASENLNYSKSG